MGALSSVESLPLRDKKPRVYRAIREDGGVKQSVVSCLTPPSSLGLPDACTREAGAVGLGSINGVEKSREKCPF